MPTATPGTPATITFPVPPAPPTGQRHPNLLNRLADALRSRHYSRRTEQTYLLEAGYGVRSIHALVGHADVSTTVIYTHGLNKRRHEVRSPVDAL